MKMKLKNVRDKIKNLFNNTLEFFTLKQEIKILRKELEESKNKEKPYIDKISSLKSENRILKILNTKHEKKIQLLQDTITELKQKQNDFFGE